MTVPGWDRLRAQTGGKFHTLFDAVSRAMAETPRELMTGQGHPHWLTLLGLGPLQPQRA